MISYFSRRSRARKVWTATLCAASFVTGQLLFGQDAPAPQPEPQAVINQYLTQPKPRPAVTIEPARTMPGKARGLQSATVQAISEAPLDAAAEPAKVEAKPLTVVKLEKSPSNVRQAVAEAKPDERNAVQPAVAEEQLAPIVPAWAMKAKKAQTPEPKLAAGEVRNPLVNPTPASSRKSQATPSNPQSAIRNPYSHDQRFESLTKATPVAANDAAAPRVVNADLELSQQPGVVQPVPGAVQPAPVPAPPAPDEGVFGILPAGSPFEAIRESGEIRIRVRRSMLLRTKVDVYRTAIVDEAVCDIVQFTPREVSIIGRSLGQTHVTFWFDDPAMPPVTYLVKVEPDAASVQQDIDKYKLLENVINEMFPDSKIYLVIVADKLLVKGQAKDSEEAAQIMNIVRAQGVRGAYGNLGGSWGGFGGIADAAATPVLGQAATGGNPGPAYQIINMLRVPGVQQVALKVKIADLNRTAARGFGVDVNAAISFSDSIEGSKLFLASLLNASSTGGTSLLTSFSGDDVNIGVRYLQERGVVKLLSEPTLVTLSGRPATFIAGGEFAVPTIVGSVGLNSVTTDFRAFGAIISFLPTIVDKDRIRLQVAPEFSQLNRANAVGGTPGLNIRAATTTVEMREGQTLAIAGLIEDSYKATNIGDLPGLAKIFGRRDTSRTETELIILVTPELVHPMDPEEVPPLPGFDITEPTGWEFFACGEIEGNPTRDYRSTVWPRLRKRYGMGGPAMTSGPFGHGQ
jgi:pilus assembly protein CpaC